MKWVKRFRQLLCQFPYRNVAGDHPINADKLRSVSLALHIQDRMGIDKNSLPAAAYGHAPAGRVFQQKVTDKPHSVYIQLQISVYEDRLYIANCGRLPENWTLEKLMGKHASAPFNPNIANVFYLAGFIESWGRRVEKICSACKEDGIPQPEYAIEPNDIMLKFTAPEDRIIHRVTERVTEGEKTIVALLVEDPSYTYKEHSEKSGMSRKTVAEKIKSLKEKSIIKRIGSDKKGYWEIKVVNE